MDNEIDLKPAPLSMFLYGLQWWAVAMPSVVILGLVAAKLQFPLSPPAQAVTLQKMFFLTGVAMAAQILAGHRLPVVTGPASVLLIGMLAARNASSAAVYTAIAIGGLAAALAAASGLLAYLQAAFTPRILVVIMLLIPFTLTPSILGLVFNDPDAFLFNLFFAPAALAALLACNKFLKGVWKATTLLWVMLAGSLFFFAFSGLPGWTANGGETPPVFFPGFEFDAGVVLSFLFCALAMTINEISSIQAVGQALKANDMSGRCKRGVLVAGLANFVSGVAGVMGPVDYTTSAGIIQATRCASRFPFLPAAGLLVLCSLFPSLLAVLLLIPGPVLGVILCYVMVAQFAAGLQMIVRERAVDSFDDGLTLAIPVIISVLAAFLPPAVTGKLPALLRPILGNAFVVGVLAVLVMEHGYNRSSGKVRR